MEKMTKKLLWAVLAIAVCLAMISCNDKDVHKCTDYEYRWKNIDGVNTYQRVCKDCKKIENLNPTKALLISGSSFADAVYNAANNSNCTIGTIEFKGNCTKPEGLVPELIVSVDTSDYEAWIACDSGTETAFISP